MRAAGFAMLDSLSADFSNGGLYQKFFESEAGPGLGFGWNRMCRSTPVCWLLRYFERGVCWPDLVVAGKCAPTGMHSFFKAV
ncbi:hypothetical protein PSCICF_06690 [Pseudomonas cichorii]|nr:hypothetical protein PSCICF_06690 [Pseudomonas cichorii]